MAREIFISYSRKDLEKVKAIKSEIEKATGAECWMDLEGGITSGEDYINRIVEGIENCRIFLFMLSRFSQESKNAIGELDGALKQQSLKGIHVVIVNVDDCDLNMRFTIKYSTLDIIAWQNKPQREKLLRDIKGWLPSGVRLSVKQLPSEDMSSEELVFKAQMYLEGDGVQKSIRKAYEYILRAANKGDARANYLLGKMLLEHDVYIEIGKESSSAFESANWCSLHGIYLEPDKNYEQAKKYLDKAAAKQYKGAMELAAEADKRYKASLRTKEEVESSTRELMKRNRTKLDIALALKNFGVEVADIDIYMPQPEIPAGAMPDLSTLFQMTSTISESTPHIFDVTLKAGFPMRRVELLLDDLALALRIRTSQIHILSPEKFRIEMDA